MSPESTQTERSRLDRFGDKLHQLTEEDARKGGLARWNAYRERQAAVKQQAAELLLAQVLESVRTYALIRDDPDAPAAARIAAADRALDRILGKVGEKLELSGPEGGPVASVRLDANVIEEKLLEAGLVWRKPEKQS